jgi:hypothetical protein
MNFNKNYVYPNSIHEYNGTLIFMAICGGVKSLAAVLRNDDCAMYNRLIGQEQEYDNGTAKICPLNHANACVIREFFPFTAPISHIGKNITIGLGDRLGLASPGHIRLIKNTDIFPVLAQQSIRELNLTGRTFKDVLDAASWAVLQEGYTKGFGADGDHLKTQDEVKMALDCGFTMITLDCSEHINYDSSVIPDIYGGAIRHIIKIYRDLIVNCGRAVDFEISIDETPFETSPEAHLYVANELQKNKIRVTSMAPRFCGEFQKGIDYIGDTKKFGKDFAEHAKIAERFGYKLSIHSGSDKFLLYNQINQYTGGKYHLKTAGTNWLEALRVIARNDTALFRQLMKYALEKLPEAKKYYVTSENIENIPVIDTLPDEELPSLLDKDDSRQVLHITYGLILSAVNENNGLLFKEKIYDLLNRYESDYYEALYTRIGRHLKLLGADY